MKKSQKAFWISIIMYFETFVQVLVMLDIGLDSHVVFILFIIQIAIFCVIGSIFIHRLEKQEKKEKSCN